MEIVGVCEDGSEAKGVNERTYSLDDAIASIGLGWYNAKVTLICSLGMMADSVMIMVIAVLQDQLKCVWKLSVLQQTLFASITFVGYAIGALIWGWSADRFGRKRILTISLAVMCVFSLASSAAPNYVWMMTFRLFVGLGAGGLGQCMILPTEMMPIKLRGKNSLFILFFWSVGAVYVGGLALLIPTVGWRWFNALTCLPTVLFLMLSWWLPESTRFLVLTGKHDAALYQLTEAARQNNAQLPAGKLEDTVSTEIRGSFFALISKKWRVTSLLLWWMWFGVQFTYYGMSLYSAEVLKSGLSGCHPHAMERVVNLVNNQTNASVALCTTMSRSDYLDFMWTTAAELPGFFLAVLLIEPLGRKLTMAICLIVGGLFFALQVVCTNHFGTIAFLFTSRAFITASSDLMYVYTPEVYPTDVRSTGLGVCAFLARVAAVMTPFVAEQLTVASFYAAVSVYSSLLLTCGVAALLLPVETRGMTLQEKSHEFEDKMAPRDGYDRMEEDQA